MPAAGAAARTIVLSLGVLAAGGRVLDGQASVTLRARLSTVPIDVAMQETIRRHSALPRPRSRARRSPWRAATEGWSRRRPPCRSTRAPGWACAARWSASSPAAAAPPATFKGDRHALAGSGHRVRQGPALRADPEREGSGRQPVGMAHPSEGTTLMARTRTSPATPLARRRPPPHSASPSPPPADGSARRRQPPARRAGLDRGPGRRRTRRLPGALRRLSSGRPRRAQRSARRSPAPSFLSVWRDAVHARARRLHPRRDAARAAPRSAPTRPWPSPRSSSDRTARCRPGPRRTPSVSIGSVAAGAAHHAPRHLPPAATARPPPPPAATTSAARCRVSRPSPTRCSARRPPATG